MSEQPHRTPRPWPPAARPSPEQLGGWLGACTPAERVLHARAALTDNEAASTCFVQDHDGRIRTLSAGQDCAIEDLRAICEALGIGGHARPISPHQVVVEEILPAIRRLRERGTT